MFGRFLLITQDKSKIIVKKNAKLHYMELAILQANNPQSIFNDKEFDKITDMVLTKDEAQVMYITRSGTIGQVDLRSSS